MAKVLDLNTVERPTLELTLQDKEKTTILVSTPSEALVRELEEVAAEMDALYRRGDKESVDAIYDLAARLISCNRQGLQVTADELRTKYKMSLESAVIFYNAYLEFINELTNEKN